MSSPSGAIVALLPAPSTIRVQVPRASTIVVPVPAAPLAVIDGAKVPFIPPFLRAQFGAVGAPGASYTSSSIVGSAGGASGSLAATVTVRQPISATFGGSGDAGYTLAFGAGTTRILPAQFSATATATATDAAFGAKAALTVTVSAVTSPVSATFGATGGLATLSGPPPSVNAASNGMGTLTAVTGVYATFGGTGAANVFQPSAMTKNGNQTGPNAANTWVPIINWTANTTGFPGSAVNSHALVAQGTRPDATVTANIVWAQGAFGQNSLAVRIKQNGVLIATGTAATTSPASASAVVSVAPGDKFSVEVQDTFGYAGTWQATITGGASSTVQVS